MKFASLLILYGLLGVSSAVAAAATRRPRPPVIDLALLVIAWPLWGPVLLMQAPTSSPHPDPTRPNLDPLEATEHTQLDDLLDALRRANNTPMGTLLPDVDAGQRLADRLHRAACHVADIDHLLTLPRYSEDEALRQQRDHRAAGDAHSAAMIDSRLQIIRRMRSMRQRFRQEINQIRELFTQLQLQAELVRIAGTTDHDTQDMVHELVCRIQGLDDVMPNGSLGLRDP